MSMARFWVYTSWIYDDITHTWWFMCSQACMNTLTHTYLSSDLLYCILGALVATCYFMVLIYDPFLSDDAKRFGSYTRGCTKNVQQKMPTTVSSAFPLHSVPYAGERRFYRISHAYGYLIPLAGRRGNPTQPVPGCTGRVGPRFGLY